MPRSRSSTNVAVSRLHNAVVRSVGPRQERAVASVGTHVRADEAGDVDAVAPGGAGEAAPRLHSGLFDGGRESHGRTSRVSPAGSRGVSGTVSAGATPSRTIRYGKPMFDTSRWISSRVLAISAGALNGSRVSPLWTASSHAADSASP